MKILQIVREAVLTSPYSILEFEPVYIFHWRISKTFKENISHIDALTPYVAISRAHYMEKDGWVDVNV